MSCRPPTSARLFRLLAAFFCSLVLLGAAPAALVPGDKAPDLKLFDRKGVVHEFDEETTSPLLIIFLKPDDRYAKETIQAVQLLMERHPALQDDVERLIIVSRFDDEAEANRFADLVPEGWLYLHDPEDKAYADYKTIATPTIVIVGKDKIVKAVRPGYDHGLPQYIRVELAKVLGVELPPAVEATPVPPNLYLQLARRMAERGLWERALEYYAKAEEAGPVPPVAQIEKAEIYVEIGEFDKALALLDGLGETENPDPTRSAGLRERIEALREGRSPEPKPPTVNR